LKLRLLKNLQNPHYISIELNIIKLTGKLMVRIVNFSINYNGNKGFRLLSTYERLNKGETVNKAQLAFIDTSEKSMQFMVKSLNQQDL
jgi:hypothetical protein